MRKKYLLFILFLSVAFLYSAPATAGPLRLLAAGGPESAFGFITFSESDVDLMRPADMLSIDRGRFSFTKEYESIINQKQGARLLNLGTSRKQRIEFFYPLGADEKNRSAFGANLYSSNLKFITNDKLGGSSLYNKGSGGAFALGHRFGRFSLGVFRNTSGSDGTGASTEINDWVSLLSADSKITTSLSMRREGFQLKADINKRLSAGFLKEYGDIRGSISFSDAEDDFVIPATLGGERRELNLRYAPPASKYSLSAFYNHGGFDNLGRNQMLYNSGWNFGFWLSRAEYDCKSFYLTKNPSGNRRSVFGYEDYDGYYLISGDVRPLDEIFPFFLPGYPFFATGYLHRDTFKYSVQKRKGNYTYRYMYSYSTGDAFSYSYTKERVGFTWPFTSRDKAYYDFKQHQLGLGFEKNISKNMIFRYSLLQSVPLLDKVREETLAPGGGGGAAAPTEKKKTRGGTLHLFSIVYLL